MTKVTIDEITYSVTVAEENVNVTVADATETVQIQIASSASDTQVLSSGGGNSLVASTIGGVTTLKSLSAGDNVTFSDDGNTVTISSTEDDLSNNTTDDLTEGTTNLYYTQVRANESILNYTGNINNMGDITGDTANFTTINGDLNASRIDSSGSNLTINPNGFLFAETDNMYVGSLTQATHITGTTIGAIGNPITITSGDIIPATHLTYDLGSPTKAWHSAYIGPGSLYIDGQKVLGSDASGDIDITTDSGQNLNISSGADVIFIPQAGETNQGFRVELDRVELGVDGDSTITLNGTVEAPDLHVGALELGATLINQTSPNQNLEIRTNGTGYIHANVADFYVGPLTGAVKIDENSISTTDTTQLTIEGFTNSADMTTAINTAESAANDYTDTREIAITTAYQTYADQAEADAITTSNSYADTAISNLVDSAPATLDTLNELAAALGDDANFSTTVTNSIATKWTQDNTKISNWDTAYGWGDHSVVGYLTSYTETDPIFTASQAFDITATNKSNWNTAYGWGDHSVEGYITDYTVTESDVTAHQAALSITESQISDLDHYTDTDARTAISLTTDSSSLTYNSSTGSFVYTDPTGSPLPANRIQIDVRNTTGSTITAGSAVYISGTSGNNQLITLADADTTNPAMGIVVSDILNNANGFIVTNGEVTGFDTSAFSVNDTLYLSATAGELTNVRPSLQSQIVQNIARVVKVHSQTGIITVQGAGRANDTPNLSNKNVFIGTSSNGVEARQLTTADITEDASNLFYTDTRAISAVQGEATLDLTGQVTMSQDLDVSGIIKVDDGFTVNSFNPFYGSGLPATAMDTSIMGIGQEEGWAGLHIRSRGEHDWGLSGFGIPPEKPRALIALSGGRLDGSSDDYLNTNDNFGSVLFNPYSGYKTGTEWLTPSVLVEAVATEDHSSSGMGTKLVFNTTENTNKAGATDSTHTNASVTIQGTTVTTSGTLKLDDNVEITGTLSGTSDLLSIDDNVKITRANSNSTEIGDYLSSSYDFHGLKIDAGDTAWSGIVFKEFDGPNKPIANFTNPGFQTEVFGGTPSSPAPLGNNKRIMAINGSAGNDTSGVAPPIANLRMLGVTTETQSTSARGAMWQLWSTPNGATSPENTLEIRNGNTLAINTDGNGVITTGGDLVLDDDVIIENTLNVKGNTDLDGTLNVDGNTTLNGNVTLGDANTDVITATGKLKASNGFKNTVLDVNTANYLANVLGIVETGDQGYISNGNGGSPCMAFFDGSNWKKMHSPADNISSS